MVNFAHISGIIGVIVYSSSLAMKTSFHSALCLLLLLVAASATAAAQPPSETLLSVPRAQQE